jgi:hypothetical protein
MDPYLEDPVLWPGAHQNLVTFLNAGLNAVLPGAYAANIGERRYVVHSERGVLPDVAVFERERRSVAVKEFDRIVILQLT